LFKKVAFALFVMILVILLSNTVSQATARTNEVIPLQATRATPPPNPTATSDGRPTPGATATSINPTPPRQTATPTATGVADSTATPSPTPAIPPGVQYYLTGNPQDVMTGTSGGLMLMGGSTDVDAAFEWLIDKSGGGDFVVIRTSGSDGYNQYVYDLGAVDSVETLVITSIAAANHPFVIEKIQNADALFIAGGDQWNYVNYWKGTALEDAIHYLRDHNVPMGGTSAGLAILGEFVFSAENGTVYSNEALTNPYNQYMTLEQDFLEFPYMTNVITDSHFRARDRMGRLVGFLARIVQDGWSSEARGIGVDEQTALLVEADGTASAIGMGGVYFLQTPGLPEVCQPATPLTYQNIDVYRIFAGGTFNLASWTGSGGLAYQVSATNGSLSSTLPRGIY
jgi:cyanophycinase